MNSSTPIPLERAPLLPEVSEQIVCELVTQHGQALVLGKCTLHNLPTAHGVIFVGANASASPYPRSGSKPSTCDALCERVPRRSSRLDGRTLQLDCSNSTNVGSEFGALTCATALPASGARVQVLSLLAADTRNEYTWTFKAKTAKAAGRRSPTRRF